MPRRREAGRVVNVVEEKRGSNLVGAHSSGATTLTVDDVTDFEEDGGELTVGVTTYSYTAINDDSSTITLASGLVTGASDDDRVDVFPEAKDRYAICRIDGEDEGDDVTFARVRHALYDKLLAGARDQDAGEWVKLRQDGGEWVVIDVLGKAPTYDADVIEEGGGGGGSHTHDGSGSASTVVGGVAEAGSTAPTASGTASVAIGDGAVSSNTATVVVGSHDGSAAAAPTASALSAIAIGSGHTSTSNDGPQATGTAAIAIGSGGNSVDGAKAAGDRGVAIGRGASASGTTGVAYGAVAVASATQTSALGAFSTASATSATAVGRSASATHQESVALGFDAATAKANQIMLGRNQDAVTHPGGVEYRITIDTTTALNGSRFHAVIIGNNATGLTYTLPAAVGSGQRIVIKNINATNMTVATNATGTKDRIDGSTANRTLAQYEVLEVVDYQTDDWAILHFGAP